MVSKSKRSGRAQILSPAEIRSLINRADLETAVFVAVAFETARNLKELAGIRRRHMTKGGIRMQRFNMTLTKKTLKLLAVYMKELPPGKNTLVFPWGAGNTGTFSRRAQRLLEVAGEAYISRKARPQDLRHSRAHHLAAAGLPPAHLMHLLGIHDWRLLARYYDVKGSPEDFAKKIATCSGRIA